METQRQTDREEKGGPKTYVANERKTENTTVPKEASQRNHSERRENSMTIVWRGNFEMEF